MPDVLLVHADRTVTLVDVKPAAFLDRPAVRAQFDWTRALCQAKGWRYEVFTGTDPTVLRNVKALAVGRRPERLPDGHLAHARAALDKTPTTLGTVRTGELPAIKIGGRGQWWVETAELEAYIARKYAETRAAVAAGRDPEG